MNTSFRKLALASAIAFAMTGFATPALADPACPDVASARQEAQITTTYALNPYLRSNDIRVSVRDGTATLTGHVDQDIGKELANEIAVGIDGIDRVDNRIAVRAAVDSKLDVRKRSHIEVIDDVTIIASIRSKLLWSRHADGLGATIRSSRGRVTLSGKAGSAEARTIAGSLASSTRGVVSVDNRMVVDSDALGVDKSIDESSSQVGRDIADTWITTKVKSTFLFSRNVSSADISVSTDDGVVTLAGKVDSGIERALAIELAQNVRGVKRVESVSLVL